MRTKNAFIVGLFSLALALLTAPILSAAVAPSSPDGGPGLDPTPSEHRGLSYSLDRAISQGVLNVQSGLLYDTIAAAVAAANAGDTLRIVAPAILEGAVTIDRDLTLEGADGDEIIFAAADTGSSGDARAWFLVDPGIDLTVRDLTFNGNGFRIYQAFRHKGTGSFDRVHFKDIQFDPSTAYQGTAIVAFGGVVNVRDITGGESHPQHAGDGQEEVEAPGGFVEVARIRIGGGGRQSSKLRPVFSQSARNFSRPISVSGCL